MYVIMMDSYVRVYFYHIKMLILPLHIITHNIWFYKSLSALTHSSAAHVLQEG